MELEVFSDLSERLKYNLPGFPLYVRKDELRNYRNFTAACHWHPDLEFISILEGTMDFFVNGRVVRLETGSGIFVNSKRLHYGFSKEKFECTFLANVVHPILLGEHTPLGKEYFESKFNTKTEDYILLNRDYAWQNEILAGIAQINDEMDSGKPNHLRIISKTASICAIIGDNIRPASSARPDELLLPTVWSMTGFIRKNYRRKIMLDDIAAAGSVCRSKCCQLFSEYVGQSPGAYLTQYRINKSCEMLRETNMTVLEVAIACGFHSPSYFAYNFQKETGLSPRKFRNLGIRD